MFSEDSMVERDKGSDDVFFEEEDEDTDGEELRFNVVDFFAAEVVPPTLSFIDKRNPLGKEGRQMVICILSFWAVAL